MEPVTLVVTGRSLHQSALMYRGARGCRRNGRWGPAPKSAPPNLCGRRGRQTPSRAPSARSMRVTSAHAGITRPVSGPSPQLSINDVYKMAESTRMRMSQESRQLVLTKTQKLVRNDSGMSRPLSGLSSMGFSRGGWRDPNPSGDPLLGASRPHTLEEVEDDNSRHGAAQGAHGMSGSSSGQQQVSLLKPRAFSANNAGSSIGAPGYHHPRHGSGRLGSALTIASSGLDSDLMGCASPRPLDSEARKMSVSRQCCEVMGPGVCRDCQKLRARMKDRERMEADFPRLRVSEKNVTTSAVLKRFLPEMTQAEIQDKIARGEIDRGGLQFPPRRFVPSDGSEDEDDFDDFKLRLHGFPGQPEDYSNNEEDDAGSGKKISRSELSPRNRRESEQRPDTGKSPNTMLLLAKLKLRLGGEASTPLFYMHLRHMNSKIFQGRVSRSVKPPKKAGRDEERVKRESRLLSVSHNPVSVQAFVSPRKSKPPEEPSYKVFFEPPLLAKHRQESTPSFFAGSDNPYHLPERLPDVIEFADGKMSLTDPTQLRSESSMSLVSGISEEGGPEGSSHRNEGLKGGKGLQETVQE